MTYHYSFVNFGLFFPFGKLQIFVACRHFGKEQIILRVRDDKHIFDFFKTWARHRFLDVPRLPREKVSAPSTFSAPVPILVAFTRQKNRGAVLKMLGTGAHFQRCRAQNVCRVNGPNVSPNVFFWIFEAEFQNILCNIYISFSAMLGSSFRVIVVFR